MITDAPASANANQLHRQREMAQPASAGALLERRNFLIISAGAAALALTGCATSGGSSAQVDSLSDIGRAGVPRRAAPAGAAAGAHGGYGVSAQAYNSARARATAIVNKMTLAEKISQTGANVPAIGRLKIPAYNYYQFEGLHGVSTGGPITSFPQPISMGQSWNPRLVQRVFDAVSTEARAIHNQDGSAPTFFSPTTVNMGGRDPRWGRLEENFSEDPLLVQMFGVAAIRGMQGDNKQWLKTIACAKHFICNDTDSDRETVSANPDPRSFWEYYTRGFEACVRDAKVFTVMSSYNALGGIPTSADYHLLTTILRKRWGFKGYVVSDCDAISDICGTHHYVPTMHQAAALAIRAGCDINCGGTLQAHLMKAYQDKLVTEEQITHAVISSYTGRILLGAFDPPSATPWSTIPPSVREGPAHVALALEIAKQSLVLLKNDQHLLPLDKSKIKKLAVLGPMAGAVRLGGYSGAPLHGISPLRAIATMFGVKMFPDELRASTYVQASPGPKNQACSEGGNNVGFIVNGNWLEYAPVDFTGTTSLEIRAASDTKGGTITVHLDSLTGPVAAKFAIPDTGDWQKWQTFTQPLTGITGQHKMFLALSGAAGNLFNIQWMKLLPLPAPPAQNGSVQLLHEPGCSITGARVDAMFAAAVHAAKQADVAIVFAGANQSVDAEGHDRAYLHLPGVQHELIQAVFAANPRTVLVIDSNCTVAANWEQKHMPAIIAALFNGEQQGPAIAQGLFGEYNPGGKTAMTWYKTVKDLPHFHNYDVKLGRTYLYFKKEPLYPFGHGLSYTTFAYDNLRISSNRLAPGQILQVSFDVKNTGSRAGDEVAQFYVHLPDRPVQMPIKQLVAFQRVALRAGETKRITLQLPHGQQALRYWDVTRKAFAPLPGVVELMVGTSSAKILLHGRVTLV